MPVGAFSSGIGPDQVGPRIMAIIFEGIIGAIALIVFFVFLTISDYHVSQELVSTEAVSS